MNFVNNWLEPITLTAAQDSATLNLPDGEYTLTIADSQPEPTRWEIVQATIVSGSATLHRGQEGTPAQAWGQGSVIYCGVTAGTLEKIGQGGGDAPANPEWQAAVYVTNFSGGVATHTMSPADPLIYALSGGTDYDVELIVPAGMPDETMLRIPCQVVMQRGSALRIRASSPFAEATVTDGTCIPSFEEGGVVLRLYFGDGPGDKVRLDLDLIVERYPEGFYAFCTLRELPFEVTVSP